jgi:hypothetical protein
MNACMYLIFKQWRNTLREKIKHPQFWIGVLVVVAYFALYIYQEINHIGESGVLDHAEETYKGCVAIGFIVIAFVGLGIGLNHGNSFFATADIDHLFVSPVRAERVIFYGLIKKCMASVLATLLLLMQLTNLRFYFGLGAMDLLILMGGWLMFSICLSVMAMAVYSVASASSIVRNLIRISLYLFSATILLGIVFALWKSGSPFRDLMKYFNEPHLHILPIGGWACGFVVAAMEGRAYMAAIYAGLLALLLLVGVLLIVHNRSAYYENVLTTIGRGFGRMNRSDSAATDVHGGKRVRKSRLLGFHRGEIVLLQRQMTEQKRSLMVFFDRTSLGMMAVAVVLGSILQTLMRKGMYPFIMQIIAMTVLCYTMIFTIPTGKFVEELDKPFIYLIPGRSFKKLFYASTAPVLKAFVEGLFCLTIVSLFARLHPAYVPCGSLFYASAALLFYASYLTSLRTLGVSNNRHAHMILTFAVMSAVFIFELSLGANIGRRLYAVDPSLFVLDFLILAVFNFAVSVVFFFNAKSILDYRA